MIVKTSPMVRSSIQKPWSALRAQSAPALECPRVTIWSPMSQPSPAQHGHRLPDIYIYNHNYSSDLNISISSISPAFSSFIPAPACYSSIIIYSKPLPCLLEFQTKIRENFTKNILFKTLLRHCSNQW